MLRDLRVQDFALIDQLHITFEPHLNVLTGETGAGKSLLIDAVTTILGGRSSPDWIRSGKQESVIEASFATAAGSPAVSAMQGMGYQPTDEIVIQRTLSASGKGRVYLNGRPVTVGVLAQVTEHLVDLHSQHDHQSLLRADAPLGLLDAYGLEEDLPERYAVAWSAWSTAQREFEASQARAEFRARELGVLAHEVEELTKANLRQGESQQLEQERAILAHAERFVETAQRIYERLHEREGSVLAEVRATCGDLEGLASIDPRVGEAVELARSALIQLQDVAQRVREYGKEPSDERRLDAIEVRLSELRRLQRKYGVEETRLVDLLVSKQAACHALQTEAETSLGLVVRTRDERGRVEALALELHDRRTTAATQLQAAVNRELKKLKMTIQFEVVLERLERSELPGPRGIDRAEFMVRPNPGEPARPLRKIASGGELSRLMLAIRTVVAGADRVPTLIFDEVDTGVGGGVAEVVGRRLQAIAEHHQVLCVTHLPQVASGALTHIVVEKSIEEGRTITRARRLAAGERVREIARMLAGKTVTPTALRHAEEMIRLVSTRPRGSA